VQCFKKGLLQVLKALTTALGSLLILDITSYTSKCKCKCRFIERQSHQRVNRRCDVIQMIIIVVHIMSNRRDTQ